MATGTSVFAAFGAVTSTASFHRLITTLADPPGTWMTSLTGSGGRPGTYESVAGTPTPTSVPVSCARVGRRDVADEPQVGDGRRQRDVGGGVPVQPAPLRDEHPGTCVRLRLGGREPLVVLQREGITPDVDDAVHDDDRHVACPSVRREGDALDPAVSRDVRLLGHGAAVSG